jgi:hypothetical protein
MDEPEMHRATFTDVEGNHHKGWMFLWRGWEMIICRHKKGWTAFEPNTGRRITRLKNGKSANKTKLAAVFQCISILNAQGEEQLQKCILENATLEHTEKYIKFHKMEIEGCLDSVVTTSPSGHLMFATGTK